MKKISYNIIDSVKGGSGKTSLSLMLAMAAQNMLDFPDKKRAMQTPNTEHAVQTLVLDMDMQGSALAGMLFGDTEPGKSGRAEQFFDQRILSYYCKSSEQFISYPKFELYNAGQFDSPAKTIKIGVALASPKMENRLAFRASSRLNYSSQITYTAFTAGLREVLTNLNKACATPPKYLFFDMPPNSNGYSDAVLELLLQKESKARKWEESACNYFALTTLDRSHMNATLEWFAGFVNESHSFPDRFFFAFNNVPADIAEMEPAGGLVEEAMGIIRERLLSILRNGKEDYLKCIYFLGIAYQADYLRTCCTRDALGVTAASAKDSPLRLEMLTPVRFLEHMLPGKAAAESTPTDRLIRMLGLHDEAGGRP